MKTIWSSWCLFRSGFDFTDRVWERCKKYTHEVGNGTHSGKKLNFWLKGPGGAENGVICSMAGRGLACTLNDGRLLTVGEDTGVVRFVYRATTPAADIDEVWVP